MPLRAGGDDGRDGIVLPEGSVHRPYPMAVMRTKGSGLIVLPVRLLTVTISPPGSSSSAILVVDDDPLVRAVTVDALEDEGFKVLETPTADDAARARESRSGIGVVFTDVILPGALNGFDLARLVQKRHPHIPVLVSSEALPDRFSGEAPGARFVPKPWSMAEVMQIIRRMLAYPMPLSSQMSAAEAAASWPRVSAEGSGAAGGGGDGHA
jgi:two-component system, response regulator PdtaR